MKKIKALFVLALLVAGVMPMALAQEAAVGAEMEAEAGVGPAEASVEAEIEAGVNPDSALYAFDILAEKLGLALTFNPQKRAEKALKIAKERMKEARSMAKENKKDAFAKASAGYSSAVERASGEWGKAEKTDANAVVEIESKAEANEFLAAEAYAEAEADFKSYFEEMKKSAERARKKAKEEREAFRSMLKEKGMAEADINAAFETAIARTGISAALKSRAEARIKQAEECLGKAAEQNVSGQKEEQFLHMQAVAEMHLEAANSAFKAESYGRAYGQANAAWGICEAALSYAEGKFLEDIEAEFEETEEESSGDVQISFNCDGAKTEVEVEIDRGGVKEETEFTLEGCADRGMLVSEIDARTSLTKEEIELYIGANLDVYTRFRFRAEEERERQKELMEKMAERFGEVPEWAEKMRERFGPSFAASAGFGASLGAGGMAGAEGSAEMESEAEDERIGLRTGLGVRISSED